MLDFLRIAMLSALGLVLSTSAGPVSGEAFIVEGTGVAAARDAVTLAGGEVTHELAIIDAVTAVLTPSQRDVVRRNPAVRSVFADASVELATASVSPAVSTVRDEFNAVSWKNDDGTHRWAGPWVESGDDGQALSGKLAVSLNLLPGLLSDGRVSISGTGPKLSRRAAIAPGATHALLRFDAQRAALESGDYLSVQASRDGYQWQEISRIKGPGNDSQPAHVALDLAPFISADTSIRFVSTMTATLLDRDAVLIDNVEIEYDSVYATGVSYPSLAGADKLHSQGITGLLVTVAVLDTGYWNHPSTDNTALGLGRVLAQYDAVNDRMDAQQLSVLGLTSLGAAVTTDLSGHGSHVTSIMMNTQRAADGRYFGIAPNANLVSVRAFDDAGRGSYSSVIRGIDWVVRNKSAYGVRVLNLSLGAAPQSRYWDDPLNRAVMKAWQAGIVVVASAGNTGPGAQTITVPGNVPYVITVGAMTDSYTAADPSDDRLASFSSAGPTYEGFVKPEVVAPGGHIWALMATGAKIAQGHPTYQNSGDYFTMSGTSQAAAVVSGAVALLLQAEPGLTPDEVKCKLMASARPAVDAQGALAYSVFQQGAGLINASDARLETTRDCANRGLDIQQDLAGTQHYGGPARQNDTGDYYVADANGYAWNQGYTWNQGYAWNQGYTWNQGYAWNQGYVWNQNSGEWNDGEPWAQSATPSSADAMSINAWVDQE